MYKNDIISVNEYYGLKKEDIPQPTNCKTIMQYQQKDKDLIKIAQNNKDNSIQNFYGANKKYSLICRNCKIVISELL